MPNREEREIVAELDREVASRGGLIALVICMTVVGVFAVTVLVDVFQLA